MFILMALYRKADHGRRFITWIGKNNKTGARVSCSSAVSSYKEKRRRRKERSCHCCSAKKPFCWMCRCGFTICQSCMDDNIWGMSCNGITWECPDCGGQNGFGNQ